MVTPSELKEPVKSMCAKANVTDRYWPEEIKRMDPAYFDFKILVPDAAIEATV